MNTATKNGRIKVGDKVLIRSGAAGDRPYWDTVRGVFMQEVVLQPYAANEEVEALVLTKRSWCRVDSVLAIEEAST